MQCLAVLCNYNYNHAHPLPKPPRDLKLDNTLLEDRLGPAHVRICDFGFAKAWTTSDNMKTAIGTPVYMSPQVCVCVWGGVRLAQG